MMPLRLLHSWRNEARTDLHDKRNDKNTKVTSKDEEVFRPFSSYGSQSLHHYVLLPKKATTQESNCAINQKNQFLIGW
jgi:hypothetical protein